MPSVEVVLCTFNGMPFLPAQVESILAQSRAVDRLTVSDDGSADGTLDYLRSARLPQATQILQTGRERGAAANFGQALRQVRGDIVLLCDQDDVWRSDKVERLLAELERHADALLVHSDARVVDAGGNASGTTLFGEIGFTPAERACWDRGEAFVILLRANRVTGATVALRRGLLELALPIPEGFWHDEWLALVAACLAPVRRVDDTLIDYRLHGGNQVGIPRIDLAGRMQGMLWNRGDYCARRVRTLELLLQRLGGDGTGVAAHRMQLLRDALEHWRDRAELPVRRLSRLSRIRRQLRTGGYRRFSNGLRSAARDFLETLP